jgi:hypothetical protein
MFLTNLSFDWQESPCVLLSWGGNSGVDQEYMQKKKRQRWAEQNNEILGCSMQRLLSSKSPLCSLSCMESAFEMGSFLWRRQRRLGRLLTQHDSHTVNNRSGHSDRPVSPPSCGSTQSTQTLRHQHLGPRSPKFGGELAHFRWPNAEKTRQHYDIVR